MGRLTEYETLGVHTYAASVKGSTSQDCVTRLAAYEDTGLTPESVEALKLSIMGKAISEITEFNGLPIDRLKELAAM